MQLESLDQYNQCTFDRALSHHLPWPFLLVAHPLVVLRPRGFGGDGGACFCFRLKYDVIIPFFFFVGDGFFVFAMMMWMRMISNETRYLVFGW